MSLQDEVFTHLGYLYFLAEDLKGTATLINSVNEWKDFFVSHWSRLVTSREESFLETLELSIDYVVLLDCAVPRGVEDFKKALYTKPSFLLSCMSAGLHLATIERYANKISAEDADLEGSSARDAASQNQTTLSHGASVEFQNDATKRIKRNVIAKKLLGGRLSGHLFFSETRLHCTRVRLENFLPMSLFSSLRSHSVGCIISIVGQVIRLSLTKPMILSALFTCNKCGCSFFKKFKNGIFECASRCYNEDCTWGTSYIRRHCVQTTNRQVIRLQEESRKELSADTRFGESTINASVDVELTGGLVDQCSPGNVVQVVGIVDAAACSVYDDIGGQNSTFNIFVKAVSLKILKKGANQPNTSRIGGDGAPQWNSSTLISESERGFRSLWRVFGKHRESPSVLSSPGSWSTQENDDPYKKKEDGAYNEGTRHNFIREIYYQEPNRFYLAAASLCRHAIGRPYIKVGLLLSLLGGVPLYKHGLLQRRGNIHCLLVGDSGVGKSLMLRSLCSMMDGAFFFSGGSITASGLTAAVIREKGNAEYCLEAGALVLSSGGTCCIDELDKTTNQQQNAFLEAMESQSVSVAKGGIICTLNAQCTVICAANPVNGKFDCTTSVYKNIKLLPPLISSDNRLGDKDEYITGHILNKGGYFNERHDTKGDDASTMKGKISHYKEHDYLDDELLKCYIEYGKTYIHPTFTAPARVALQRFYCELKSASKTHSNAIPITTRQLEGIIRLCQARARGDLCDHITEEHVADVCELFKNTGHYPGYVDTISQNPTTVKKTRGKSAAAVMNVFETRLRAYGTREMDQQTMLDLARDTLKTCKSDQNPQQLLERGMRSVIGGMVFSEYVRTHIETGI